MAALAVLHVVLRGVQPLMPGFAGVLRVLIHPLVLVFLAVLVLLFRTSRTRRKHDTVGHARRSSEHRPPE